MEFERIAHKAPIIYIFTNSNNKLYNEHKHTKIRERYLKNS